MYTPDYNPRGNKGQLFENGLWSQEKQAKLKSENSKNDVVDLSNDYRNKRIKKTSKYKRETKNMLLQDN